MIRLSMKVEDLFLLLFEKNFVYKQDNPWGGE
jgi:hypothetical protein